MHLKNSIIMGLFEKNENNGICYLKKIIYEKLKKTLNKKSHKGKGYDDNLQNQPNAPKVSSLGVGASPMMSFMKNVLERIYDGLKKSLNNLKNILIIAIVIFGAVKLIPYILDKINSSDTRYTFAESSIFRSSPFIQKNNVISSLSYGQEVKYIEDKNAKWASVSYSNRDGYISSALLITRKEFLLLNSIFGGQEMDDTMALARKMIPEVSIRKALIEFYISKQYLGRMTQETAKEAGFDFAPNEDNQWIITKRTGKSKRVNVLHSDNNIVGIIIQNVATGKRKSLVFCNSGDNQYKCFYSEDAPQEGGIVSVRRMSDHDYKISYSSKSAVKELIKKDSSDVVIETNIPNSVKEQPEEKAPEKENGKNVIETKYGFRLA